MRIGRHTFAGLGTSSLVMALALGWSAAGANTPKKTVDWVKVNPAFVGATFVNDPETCRTCHEDYMKAFAGTTHARAFSAKPPATTGACESCHGPRSKHVESPDASLNPRRALAPSPPSASSATREAPAWAGRLAPTSRTTSGARRVTTS
jgi:hypothetical protein